MDRQRSDPQGEGDKEHLLDVESRTLRSGEGEPPALSRRLQDCDEQGEADDLRNDGPHQEESDRPVVAATPGQRHGGARGENQRDAGRDEPDPKVRRNHGGEPMTRRRGYGSATGRTTKTTTSRARGAEEPSRGFYACSRPVSTGRSICRCDSGRAHMRRSRGRPVCLLTTLDKHESLLHVEDDI